MKKKLPSPVMRRLNIKISIYVSFNISKTSNSYCGKILGYPCR